MKYAIGIDVGGTNIRTGLISDEGKTIVKQQDKTPSTKKELINIIIKQIVKSLLIGKEVCGIGIGLPGIVDFQTKKMIFLPHINFFKNTNIVLLIKKKFKIPCFIDNDAHCAMNGELYFFLKRKYKSIVMLTFGTGTGSAIAINGKLYSGINHSVGGFGEMIIEIGGEKCSCGRRGCLNAYMGQYGIIKIGKKILGKELTPEQLFNLCTQGDKKAKQTYAKIGYYLGFGLANIVNILSPQLIIFSGSISNAWIYMREQALRTMRENLFGIKENPVQIKISRNRKDSGIIGAASLVFSNIKKI